MSLTLLKGGSGTGKSYRLFSEILAHAAEYPNQNHIILVPEQYNLYTQRKLVSLSANGGIMNIEALSFERLAFRVFDELGTKFSDVLEDEGKALLLRRICQENETSLKVLSSGIRRSGFIDEIKSLISELMQYDISPEKLSEYLRDDRIRSIGPSFVARMEDIAFIYEKFTDSLEDKYITTEQILSLLVEVISESSFIKGAYIALDGYTGLTPLQRNLMREVMALADKVYACITIDKDESIYDENPLSLFAMSRDYAKSLLDIASECGVEAEDIICINDKKNRYKNSKGLAHLSSNIFRKKIEISKDENIDESINIYSFEQKYDELSFVAKDICERIKANPELSFKDFAILSPDMSVYRYHIEDILADYGIPVFIDSKDNVETHPLVAVCEAVLKLFLYDFSYETVMDYIGTGFCDLSEEEADIFDNYLLATGIRTKKRFDKNFTRYINHMEPEDLDNINEIRKKIMAPFAQIDFLKEDSVINYTTSLYNVISLLGCEEKISEEDGRIYRSIIDLFDKIVHLLSESEIELQEYADIVHEGLSNVKIGVLPRSMDTVLFGDMERSRVGDISILYMIGMSDNKIPKRTDGGGLLLQSERIRLLDMDVALAPSDRQKIFMEKFYIYLALSKPSKGLIISYSMSDDSGSKAEQAYFIDEIKKIFPNLKTEHISKNEISLRCSSAKNLADNISSVLRDSVITGEFSEEFKVALSYLKKHDEKAYNMLLSAAGFKYESTPIKQAILKAKSGRSFNISASRLEKYASCAYAYFLQYELKLKERKEYGMDLSDMGNVYHDALRRYSDAVSKSKFSWFDIPKAESDKLLEKAIEDAFEANDACAYIDTQREAEIINRMRNTLRRSVWAIASQVKSGKFEPKGFEVSIEKMSAASCVYELDDTHKMRMNGTIDRLDTYETQDSVYIKIIDYKSGEKDINLSEAYEGLQLQLLFYLKAVCDSTKRQHPDKRVIPAAVLYYHVDNPMVKGARSLSDEHIEELIKKAFRNNGLICDDLESIEALDTNVKEAIDNGVNYTSVNIPVTINKNGSFNTKSTKTVSEADMNTLGDYAAHKAVKCGRDIIDGKFDVNPYKKNDSHSTSACTYCPYHSVCGFDIKVEGFKYNYVLDNEDRNEIIEKMKKDMEQK